MSRFPIRAPRGLTFLVGATLVACVVIGLLVAGGPSVLGNFGAPDVLIADPGDVDVPMGAAAAGTR